MITSLFYPLALLGGLAIAVPIWLHLRKEEHPDLIEFSALQFLDDAPVAASRPVRPRDWLLLLLRILALLLIVLAFSWPYLPIEQEAVIEESRVYILDNTLSHQVNGQFERARDRIADDLRDAGPKTQVAIVELTSSSNPIVRFGDTPADMAGRISKLEPSSQRGSYLEAFRLAQQLLDRSLGAKHRIVFLGDNQKNQWNEGQNVAPFLEDVEIELPETTDFPSDNLSLDAPRIQRFIAGNRDIVDCTVQLTRRGDAKEVTLNFTENGERVGQQTYELSDESETYLLRASWPTDHQNWLLGEVSLDQNDDALSLDDRVYFSLPPILEGTGELYADSVYLRTALSPEIMQGRWKIASPDLPLPNEAAENTPDVICVEGHRLREEAVRTRVMQTLQQGHGLILFLDEISPVISGFLRELGIEGEPGNDLKQGESSTFRYIFEDHPIFADFRATDFGNLNDIGVTRYRRLTMEAGLPLAFSQSGHPLILEGSHGNGKLLVFSFALDAEETNWPLNPTIIPFLDRCLNHLRQEQVVEHEYQPGEACVWSVPPGCEIESVRLLSEGEPVIEAAVQNGQARFRIPDAPGHYRLHYDDEENFAHVLDVNPAPEESELEFLEKPSSIDLWKREPNPESESSETPDKVSDLATSEILKQKVWWWFILAAIMVLVIETIWISLRKEN